MRLMAWSPPVWFAIGALAAFGAGLAWGAGLRIWPLPAVIVGLATWAMLRARPPRAAARDGRAEQLAELQLRLADAEVERDAARSELRAAEAEIRRRRQVAAERLDKSTRELREFAFAATHDLQEPLRKIRMFGDLLEEDERARLSPVGQAHLARMRQAADHFEGLLDDLLDLHRPDQVPKAARIDLAAVAREAVREHAALVEEADAEVHIGELATIEADPGQIRRLMAHLVGNALKFRRAGVRPRVDIGGRYLERPVDGTPCFALTVSDNGIGFDRRYVNRIFQLFQRLHTAEAYPGRGIGLTLCRRIVEAHDGAITAQSAPGEGSTFIVTLPIQRRAMTLPPMPRQTDGLLPPISAAVESDRPVAPRPEPAGESG